MGPLSISADHARRFLVRRHLLDPPRSLPASPDSVLAAVERLGSLQFDPLETPGARNHDLVLHARIQGYQKAWCDQWLYGPPGERRLFEAYNKGLNILPAHELPYYRIAWDHAEERYRTRILKVKRRAVSEILERLKAEGPLSTAAVSKTMAGTVDWHWAPTAEGRAVLEALFEMGRIGIARRDKSRRTFDLIERLFPEDLLKKKASPAEAMRHRLLSRFRGMGLKGASGSPEMSIGTGYAAERAAMLKILVSEGALVPVEVEGVRGLRYMLREELPILDATGKPARQGPAKVALLAPLDPILWDRKLLQSLFSFDYKWEVYVPEAKRRHGYYVLPILFGDRLVGRIEPRIDRKEKALRILCLKVEPGFNPAREEGFVDGAAEALVALADLVGAESLIWPRTRLAAEVGRAVRRALEAPT
jgi:hypothetical protein